MFKFYFTSILVLSVLFMYLTYPKLIQDFPNVKEKVKLKKPIELDDSLKIQISICQITQGIGKSFKYYKELEKGQYLIKRNNDYVDILILNENINSVNDQKIIDEFKLDYIKTGKDEYNLELDKNDAKRLIKYDIDATEIGKFSASTFPEINNNIIWDQEILKYDEEYTLGKIFNKVIALDKTINQFDVGSVVFYDIDDAVLLPYDDGQGSKLLVSDGGWSSIIQFDSRNTTEIDSYGSFGTGNDNFIFNNGITCGRSYTQGDNVFYPVFIADIGNNRIVQIKYIINNNTGIGYFDNTTFSVFKSGLKSPFDISYFKTADSTDTNDKIWISEVSARQPAITCISVANSTIIQRFKGYTNGNNGDSLFKEFSRPRLCTYDYSVGNFCALVITDDKRNVVVPCVLNGSGLANIHTSNGDTIIEPYNTLLSIPKSYPITSVNIHRTSYGSVWYPYLWVTTRNNGSNLSMIHAFAINSNANWGYLGSSNLPRNTDYYFHDLTNTFTTQIYYDLFTSEIWSDSYGLRRYLPFIDIKNDVVKEYCNDSTDQLYWEAAFTNECWIKIWCERKVKSNVWEQVAIKKIEGSTKPPNTYESVIWRLKGYTALTGEDPIDIKLNLPFKDYVFGGNVRLHARLYPEYFDYNNLDQYSEYIAKDYEVDIKKTCLPKPGGCPYIYVLNNQNEFEADNNILHKMEFSTPGTDILDVYKLRVAPKISNNSFDIYIAENEQDSAFIDRVRVFAVDYPSNKKLGVTEDNKIVIYDSVQVLASDSVMHNNTNITNNVHFHHPADTLTIGEANDSMYAHFSNLTDKIVKYNVNSDFMFKETRAVSINSSKLGPNVNYPVAFITNLRNLENPIIADKDTAGFLTAASIFSNSVSKIFSRRELESVVILPLFADTDKVDHLNIKWQSNFRMKYLGIANLSYSVFTATEVPMSKGSAITAVNDTDITSLLTSDNGKYGEVNSGKLIKMTFDLSGVPSPGLTDKREFVIEVEGNYIKGSGSLLSKVSNNLPTEFFISQNYPNPFNPVTKINYELPRTSKVNIVVYDILGREVKRLLNNEIKEAGRYVVEFDGKNYASGVYFLQIRSRRLCYG